MMDDYEFEDRAAIAVLAALLGSDFLQQAQRNYPPQKQMNPAQWAAQAYVHANALMHHRKNLPTRPKQEAVAPETLAPGRVPGV